MYTSCSSIIDGDIELIRPIKQDAAERRVKQADQQEKGYKNNKKCYTSLYSELGMVDPLEKCDKCAEFKCLIKKKNISFYATFNLYNLETEMRLALRYVSIYVSSIMSKNYSPSWNISCCKLLA